VVIAPLAREGPSDPIAFVAPPRTLLIDRQPLFLAAMRRLLSSPPLNAEVAVSTQSSDAVDLSAQTEVDLIVCDLRAEPVSGAELAGVLADRSPEVRVILLADWEDRGELVAALLCGATGFFTKDTSVEEFLDGVQAVRKGCYTVGRNLLQQTLAKLGGKEENHEPINQLSPTEHSILMMIAQAQSIRAIATARGISQKTVRNHLGGIYRKLHLRNRTEAILWAFRHGLVPQNAN
jgi:DNA-binding NarL/FixJ family response regulator